MVKCRKAKKIVHLIACWRLMYDQWHCYHCSARILVYWCILFHLNYWSKNLYAVSVLLSFSFSASFLSLRFSSSFSFPLSSSPLLRSLIAVLSEPTIVNMCNRWKWNIQTNEQRPNQQWNNKCFFVSQVFVVVLNDFRKKAKNRSRCWIEKRLILFTTLILKRIRNAIWNIIVDVSLMTIIYGVFVVIQANNAKRCIFLMVFLQNIAPIL